MKEIKKKIEERVRLLRKQTIHTKFASQEFYNLRWEEIHHLEDLLKILSS